jgi:phosphoribosylformylglycinamidine (FGAM) synthase-like enzyme
VFRQYDRHVQNNTLLSSEHNTAGLIQLRNAAGELQEKALAATLDGNPRHVALDAYTGTLGVVCEAARNLVAVGAKPLAVTNNLNFANPETATGYYPLYFAVEGLKEACLALETPITGGNVSLYNTTGAGSILPSPVVGMVGVLPQAAKALGSAAKEAGEVLLLLGRFAPSIGGSEYQWLTTGKIQGAPPSVHLRQEKATLACVLALNEAGLLQAAQDVSVGGLLPTVLELLEARQLGASLSLASLAASLESARLDTLLFGETHGSFVLSVKPEALSTLQQRAADYGISCYELGSVLPEPQLRLSLPSVAESLTFSLPAGPALA